MRLAAQHDAAWGQRSTHPLHDVPHRQLEPALGGQAQLPGERVAAKSVCRRWHQLRPAAQRPALQRPRRKKPAKRGIPIELPATRQEGLQEAGGKHCEAKAKTKCKGGVWSCVQRVLLKIGWAHARAAVLKLS